ncbi:MAG: PEGA domain-containing protein [Candidatus Velthaea sp.]
MFLRLASLAACACFFLLGAVPTGALYVTTLPTNADVWLDGTYVGQSPVVLDALSAGRHTVSLTRTGWMSQDIDVSVVAGTTALSSVVLAHAGSRAVRGSDGSFSIKGMPARSLLLDGVALTPDATGTYVVASGTHQVVAQTAAGRMTRTITIYPDMRTDVMLRDESAAPHSAVVAPTSVYLPATAVKIDGVRVTIRYERHAVDAVIGSPSYRFDGRTMSFDVAPTLIGAELYLPLELLKALTANDAKAN